LTRRLLAAAVVGALAIVLLGSGGWWLQRRGLGGITALALSSCAYAAAVAVLVLLWPAMAGMSRAELLRGLRTLGWRQIPSPQ